MFPFNEVFNKMIAYDLQCPNGHVFEGWFEDSKAYARQQNAGLITCPVCNQSGITRLPSTFAIKGKQPTQPPSEGPQIDPQVLQRAIRHYVENHFDNVGADFASEALKIHYGVSEPRNIRGSSTSQEEETLRKEGVEFFKFPLPDPDTPTPSSDS
jgi:hypothetical protein